MVSRLSLLFRLLTLLPLVVPPVLMLRPPPAIAAGDDDEEGGGGGDEGEEGEEGAAEDKDQPEVTAGGLFTIDNYPETEAKRPLTMTQGIFEGRAGINFDLSKGQT